MCYVYLTFKVKGMAYTALAWSYQVSFLQLELHRHCHGSLRQQLYHTFANLFHAATKYTNI